MEGSRQNRVNNEVLSRVRIILALLVFIVVIIILRVLWIQFGSSEIALNTDKMHHRIFRPERVEAHRGTIFSRDGDPLAISIQRYHVEMDFGSEGFDSLRTFRTQSDSLAKLLSAYFKDRTTAQYRELFRSSRDKHYQLNYIKDTLVRRSEGWFDHLVNIVKGKPMKIVKLYDTIRSHRPVKIFPRDVDYAEWQVLRRYPILNWNMGMTYRLVGSDDRIYPHGELARRTIGKINADRGQDYGIELVYNDHLEGVDGEEMRQRIARGFYGRVAGGKRVDAVDGLDVVTTIDAELQDVVHRVLYEQMVSHRAEWGTTVVMEVETGDILAMVNLDRDGKGGYVEGENRAIGAKCEPGSTLKLAATLALLDDAGMSTSQLYDTEDGRRVSVGKTKVQDSHKGNNVVDLRTAFAQSLNVYFAKAVYEYYGDDPTRYSNFLKRLGLDKRVGFEAYGEPMPLVPARGSASWWEDVTLINQGYGYGLEITPLQSLTYYNGVANNGKIVAPRLIKEIRRDGRVVERFPTRTLVDKMCTQQTLDTVRSFMVEVCRTGSGAMHLGHFGGFEAAAKSGTAQYVQGKYKRGEGCYFGTMVGYMPADKPKYSIISSLMKHRSNGTIYGSSLGGPVVRDVMQYLYNQQPEWHSPLDTIPRGRYPVAIKGGESAAVDRIVRELMPRCDRVNGKVAWSRAEVDSLSRVSYSEVGVERGVMPNLYNMSLRDAMFILEDQGLKVDFIGNGRVYRQSVRAGTLVREGATITLTLR
ncbi:MAG: penicillin-binding transpeptidase domain-containing protein [Rikenellaceae bacterium]